MKLLRWTYALGADGDVVVIDIETLLRRSPNASAEAKLLKAAHQAGIGGAAFGPGKLHHIDLFTVHRIGESLAVDPDSDCRWGIVELPFQQKPFVKGRRRVAAVCHFAAALPRWGFV